MLSRGILIVLSAFYAALFVIQVPRSLLRSRGKKEISHARRFEALLYLSWKILKILKMLKVQLVKITFVKFPSKFSIHSCKLSLKKREKKLEILYMLN